jgi:hypothetical protein|tara:strand:- start:224 stop:412 length:189 start_codon:yes stop_codon:yes gene_type:complete
MDKKKILKQIKEGSFSLKNASEEIKGGTLESITYDNQVIEHYMGDSTGKEIEFQVLKIKRDK